MPKESEILNSRHDGTHPLIWCVAIICTVITLAVILTGIVVFIGYLVIRPRVPFVRVTYARLDAFNFDETGVLSTKLTIVINAENDNHKAHASFSDFRYILTYDGIKVASLELRPGDTLEVANNKSLPLPFVVEARPIPLDSHQMTFASLSLKKNVIPFELNGHSRVRWKVGPLGSVRFLCNMNCLLQFQTNGSSFNSHCSSKSI